MLTNSKLGFGLMRLPRNDGNEINLPKVCEMVDEFIEKGFTYFDTAYVYEGSEEATRACLTSRHSRESYTIASKLPAWEIKCAEDMPRIFYESLARLGVEYIDFYLLHAIGENSLPVYDKYDAWGFLRKLKAEGKVKHIGFSFHSTPAMLEELLTAHPEVEFVQLQINYLDWEDAAVRSREILSVANAHGVPVIVMEPVKGGQLALLPPREAARYKEEYPSRSASSFALRFAASQPGVMTVLSGMSSAEQMKDNLSTFTNFSVFGEKDYALMDEIVSGIRSYPYIPCTNCRYCVEGCPKHIKIPDLFRIKNRYDRYGDKREALTHYKSQAEGAFASDCIRCGKCEKVCPQHIAVREQLKKIEKAFED